MLDVLTDKEVKACLVLLGFTEVGVYGNMDLLWSLRVDKVIIDCEYFPSTELTKYFIWVEARKYNFKSGLKALNKIKELL